MHKRVHLAVRITRHVRSTLSAKQSAVTSPPASTMATRSKCASQLQDYAKTQKTPACLTTSQGIPIDDKTNSITAGPRGPMLLQDTVYQDEMAHFDRERIPERVVHAKGAGAFGQFEVTHDITKYTKASVFSKIGKKTRVAVRFSTVGGESGSADTARDPRGFAVKFYTDEGIWDLTGNNTPIFFIRDPLFFSSFIHTQKRNPQTHLKDADMFWDFISLRPESSHQVSFLFGDRGIPNGYRHMNGYGSHTFKLVNKDSKAVYCKFHLKTDQGIKNILAADAEVLAGKDPDYSIRDLFESIAQDNYPSWTMYIQVMTYEEAKKHRFNPFDVTKIWPHSEFPLNPVGKMVLNENPVNYFVDVEQAAFSPANMPPGIEASPDKMLQGRLYSYDDTHRHRLGPNFQQIPVNRPVCPYANYQRDGFMAIDGNQGGAPNYYPNSFTGPVDDVKKFGTTPVDRVENEIVARHESKDDDNFTQVGWFYRKVLDEAARTRLIENMAGHLKNAADFIQERTVKNFSQADPEYGSRLAEALKKYKN